MLLQVSRPVRSRVWPLPSRVTLAHVIFTTVPIIRRGVSLRHRRNINQEDILCLVCFHILGAAFHLGARGCCLGGLVCVLSLPSSVVTAKGYTAGLWEALNVLRSIRSLKHYLLLLFFFKVGQAVLAFQALIPGSIAGLGHYGNCRKRSSWLCLGSDSSFRD